MVGGVLLLVAGLAVGALAADEGGGDWPLRLSPAPLQVAFYEPSVETFEGEWLGGRAAVAVTREADEPVFGAVWFRLRVRTDYQLRQVMVRDCEVVESRFPADLAVDDRRLAELIEQRLPGARLHLDALLASLAREDAEAAAAMAGQDVAPEIVWVPYPVSVVRTDGVPRLQEVAELPGLLQVVNTDALIVVHGGRWFLLLGDAWLVANDFYGEWTVAAEVPAGLRHVGGEAERAGSAGEVPRVLVADRPLEVIETAGPPSLSVIPGSSLLVVTNTDADLFFEIGSQRYYVLLAGRWFAAESLSRGPWAAVDAEQLPSSFAALPTGGAKAGVLAHVPGTEAARQAVLEAQTPTVQAVSREATATVVVDYRGEPSFAPIGTLGLYYAVNSPYSVLRVGASFYLCLDGVWYWSGSAHGPWRVSLGVPAVIYAIPPHYPVYPVTYVRIYDWTPSYVYVGYTSGYYGWHVGYGRRGLVFGFSYYDPFWHWPVAVYCPPRPIYYHRPVVYHRVALRGYHYSAPLRPRAVVTASGGHVRPVSVSVSVSSSWRSPSHYASGHGRGAVVGDRVRPVAGGVADGRRSVSSVVGRESPGQAGRSSSRLAGSGSSGFAEWRDRESPAVTAGGRGSRPAPVGADRPSADSARSRVPAVEMGSGAPSGGAAPGVGGRDASDHRPALAGVERAGAERMERVEGAVGESGRPADASGVRIFSRSPGMAEGRVASGGGQASVPPATELADRTAAGRLARPVPEVAATRARPEPEVLSTRARPLPEVPVIRAHAQPSVVPASREPTNLAPTLGGGRSYRSPAEADGPRIGGGGAASRPSIVPTPQAAPPSERQSGQERFGGQRLQVPSLPVVPLLPQDGRMGGSGAKIDMPALAVPKASQVLQGGGRPPVAVVRERSSTGLPGLGMAPQAPPAVEARNLSGAGRLSMPSVSQPGGAPPAVGVGASPASSGTRRGRGFGQ